MDDEKTWKFFKKRQIQRFGFPKRFVLVHWRQEAEKHLESRFWMWNLDLDYFKINHWNEYIAQAKGYRWS